jgi:hypothetical protein
MKYGKILLSLLFLLSFLSNCSQFGKKISGIYECEGESLIGSIELSKDGVCYIRDGIMGFRTSYEYKIQGDTLIISGGSGSMSFQIENDNVLVGTVFPVEGERYIKKNDY